MRTPAPAYAWDLLQAGRVARFHTLPGGLPQSTAEHSGRVALLCFLLTNGRPSVKLLWYAITHDLAEALTGDVPAPAKWANLALGPALAEVESRVEQAWSLPSLEDLPPSEQDTFKLADCLDGMFTCVQARRQGNHEVGLVYHKWRAHLLTQWPEPGQEWANTLDQLYENPSLDWDPWEHM